MMLRRVALALCLLAPAGFPALAQGPMTLPSGNIAQLHDQIWDEDMAMIRLRYVVAALALPDADYGSDALEVFEDMSWLCGTQLRSLFPENTRPQDEGWRGAIITMMAQPVEFGTRDPDITQFFESFLFADDGCILEDDLYHE